MKDLKTFVNEKFDEDDALEALIDEACDEFIAELEIDGDDELQESVRKRAGNLKNKARNAVKNGGAKLKSSSKNAKSKAKNFVKSLWDSDDHVG
jgi:ElaB/YqjD/DUF883 family membrane-anchored ribosome-binding protein